MRAECSLGILQKFLLGFVLAAVLFMCSARIIFNIPSRIILKCIPFLLFLQNFLHYNLQGQCQKSDRGFFQDLSSRNFKFFCSKCIPANALLTKFPVDFFAELLQECCLCLPQELLNKFLKRLILKLIHGYIFQKFFQTLLLGFLQGLFWEFL